MKYLFHSNHLQHFSLESFESLLHLLSQLGKPLTMYSSKHNTRQMPNNQDIVILCAGAKVRSKEPALPVQLLTAESRKVTCLQCLLISSPAWKIKKKAWHTGTATRFSYMAFARHYVQMPLLIYYPTTWITQHTWFISLPLSAPFITLLVCSDCNESHSIVYHFPLKFNHLLMANHFGQTVRGTLPVMIPVDCFVLVD